MSKLVPDRPRLRNAKGVIIGILAFAAGGLGATYLLRSSADPETLAQRAGAAFMDRRFDDAEANLARVKQLRPSTPLDLMLAAQLAIVQGRVDEAIGALAKVPDDYSMASQARIEAGQLELRRYRYVGEFAVIGIVDQLRNQFATVVRHLRDERIRHEARCLGDAKTDVRAAMACALTAIGAMLKSSRAINPHNVICTGDRPVAPTVRCIN